MSQSNAYKIQSISENKNKTQCFIIEYSIIHTNLNKNFVRTLTLFKSFVSLSIKFDESCDTTGRKIGVNGSS